MVKYECSVNNKLFPDYDKKAPQTGVLKSYWLDNNTIECKKLATIVSGRKRVDGPSSGKNR